MYRYWRDLQSHEEKRVGDRFLNEDGDWEHITQDHIDFEQLKKYVDSGKYFQREANCVPPIENGTNQFGVDVGYFRKTINRELNHELDCFRPHELARVFARLSVAADKDVIFEDEFQRTKAT